MRIAVYGLGRMGRHHARHLRGLGAQVVEVDPALGLHGDARGIDAAVVATPTRTHAEIAASLARDGVPVLVEKPLAASLGEAEALADFSRVVVGHVERFNPAFAALLGDGLDVRFVHAERLAPWSDRAVDVDVVYDLMVHDLDLFGVLTGFGEVADVRANGLSVATVGPDIAHARVELVDGRVAVLSASRISPSGVRKFRAFAPGRYVGLDLGAKTAHAVGRDLVSSPLPVAEADALREELASFLSWVEEGCLDLGAGPARLATVHEALWTLRLAERIRCASA